MIKINSTRLQSIVDDYKECLKETIEDYNICLNLKEDDKYYRQLRSAYRDDINKKPTTKVLLNFFKDNKKYFMNFEKFIDERLKNTLESNNDKKDIFQVKK